MSPNFQLLWRTFTKFLILFSKSQVNFSSNFVSLSGVMKDSSSVLFWIKNYILFMQGANQNVNLSARIKIHQILVSFETTNQFFFKFCINLQFHETQLLCIRLAEIFICFQQKYPIKVQNWWNRKSEIWHFDGLPSSK